MNSQAGSHCCTTQYAEKSIYKPAPDSPRRGEIRGFGVFCRHSGAQSLAAPCAAVGDRFLRCREWESGATIFRGHHGTHEVNNVACGVVLDCVGATLLRQFTSKVMGHNLDICLMQVRSFCKRCLIWFSLGTARSPECDSLATGIPLRLAGEAGGRAM